MFNGTTFVIKERVGLLKLSDTYDIFDPSNNAQVGIAKERPGGFIHFLRFFLHKNFLPTKIFVYEGATEEDSSRLLFSIERGFSLLRPRVTVKTPLGETIGWFKSRLFTLGGAFDVFNAQGALVAAVKGDWKGWNFKFLDATQTEIGTVTKKWAGLGKELFTTADTYVIDLHPSTPPDRLTMLLAAGLAVDVVYKER